MKMRYPLILAYLSMLLIGCLLLADFSARQTVIASGKYQGGGSPLAKFAGTWEMYVGAPGAATISSADPVVMTLEVQGNRFLGFITVPIINPSLSGLKAEGSVKHPILDADVKGDSISFRIVDDGSTFEATLTKLSDDEYVGEWKSLIAGRWQSRKQQVSGKLRMLRK